MGLMSCPECKELISDRARACTKCELPLVAICSDCGSDIRYPGTACPQCGCPLKAVVQDLQDKQVSDLANMMFKAQMEAKVADLDKPRTNGIYVSQQAEKGRGAYGFLKADYSRGFLQFRNDGSAFYQAKIALPTADVNDAVLRMITGNFEKARCGWKMVDSTIELTDIAGQTFRAKVNASDGILLSHPKFLNTQQYQLVETDYQLKCW